MKFQDYKKRKEILRFKRKWDFQKANIIVKVKLCCP